MPIARFQMPDGRIARFEVPEGTSPEEAQALMEQAVASGAAAPKPARRAGIGAEFSRGLDSLLGSSGTGIAAFGGQEAANRAAEEGLQRSRAIDAKYGASPWERVKQKYNDPKGGFASAAGEFVANMPAALASQAPQLGVSLGAAKLGAMAGAPLGPIGSAVGAGGAAIASMYPQFLGSGLETQAAEAAKAGRPINVDLPAAHLAAAGSAALEVGGGALALGRGVVSKVLGLPAKTIAEQSAKAGAKLAVEAQRTLAGTVARGAGRGLAVEMPVELAQAVMNRAQAGMSLTDDEAMAEYGNTLGATAMVAPAMGAAGRVYERGQAQRTVAQLEEQKQIKAEQDAAALQQQQEAQKATQRQDPAYAADVADRYQKAEATYRSMLPGKLDKNADEATKFEHAARAKQAKEFLETELKPLIPEYLAVKPVLQAAQAAQQPTAAPAPAAEPSVEEEAGLLFPLAPTKLQPPAPAIPTAEEVEAQRAELAGQQQALDVHLETLRDQAAKAAQAGDTETAIRLSKQFKQAEQARDAAAQQIAALPKAPKNVDLAKQLEKAKQALALAGENGDPDAILRAAAKVEKLKAQGAELMQPGPEMEMVPAGGKSESQAEFFPKVATDTLSPKPLQLPFDATKIAVPDRGQGPARLPYDPGTDIRAMEANRMDTSQTAQPDLLAGVPQRTQTVNDKDVPTNRPEVAGSNVEMKTQVKQGVGDVSTKSRAQLLADLQIARAAGNKAAATEAIEGLRDLKARGETAAPGADVSNIAGSQLAATMGSRLPSNVAKQQAARDAVARAYGNFVSILNRFSKGLAKKEELDTARKQILDNLVDDIGITRGLPLTAPEAQEVQTQAKQLLHDLQSRFGDTRDVINQGTEKEPELSPVQERDGTFIRDRIERPQGTANLESRRPGRQTFGSPYAAAQSIREGLDEIRNNAINGTPGVPGVVGKQTKTVTSPEDLDEAIAKAKPSPLLERLKDNLPAFASDPGRRNLAAEWLHRQATGVDLEPEGPESRGARKPDVTKELTAELDRLEGGKRSETENTPAVRRGLYNPGREGSSATAVQSEMFDGKGTLFDTFEEFDAYLAGDAVRELNDAIQKAKNAVARAGAEKQLMKLNTKVTKLRAEIAKQAAIVPNDVAPDDLTEEQSLAAHLQTKLLADVDKVMSEIATVQQLANAPTPDTMSRIRQRAAPLERRVAELKANIANLQTQRARVQAKGTEQAAAAEERIAAAQAKLDGLLSAVEAKLEPLRAEAREAQQALQDAYQTIADIEARISANMAKFNDKFPSDSYVAAAMDTLEKARAKHIELINEPDAVANIQQGVFLRPDVIAAGKRANEALVDAIQALQKEPSSRAVQAFLNRDLALQLELQAAQEQLADAQAEAKRADDFVEMGTKVFEAAVRKSPEGAAAQRALRTAKTTAENARSKREGRLASLAADINRLGDELDASTKALAAELKPALKRAADRANPALPEDLEAKANAERKAENERLERLADIPGEQVTFTDLAAVADKFAELPEKVARLERKAADETLPKTTRAKAKNDAKKYRTRMETLHGLLSDDPETVNAARDAAQKQLDDVKARIEAKKQAVNADGITDKVRLSRTAELYDLRSELRDLQKFVDGFGKKVKRAPVETREERKERLAGSAVVEGTRLPASKQGPLMKKETVAGNIRTGDLGTTDERKLSPRNPIVQGGQTRSPTSTQAQRAAAADTAYERAMIRLGELEDVQTRAENALEVAEEAGDAKRVDYLKRGLEALQQKIDAQQKIVDSTVTGRKRKVADLGTKFDDVADKPKEAAALASAEKNATEPRRLTAAEQEAKFGAVIAPPDSGKNHAATRDALLAEHAEKMQSPDTAYRERVHKRIMKSWLDLPMAVRKGYAAPELPAPKKAPAPVATPEPQQTKPGSQTQSDAAPAPSKPRLKQQDTQTPQEGIEARERWIELKYKVTFDKTSPIHGLTYAEAARWGAEKTNSPLTKQLFLRLAEMLDGVSTKNGAGRVYAVGAPGVDAQGFAVTGHYSPTFDYVLSPAKSSGRARYINTLLHELMHAATSRGLYTDPALNRIVTNLRERVIEWTQSGVGKAHVKKAYLLRHKMRDGTQNIYGLTNNQEFMAELYSNRQFQDMLAAIPSEIPVQSVLTRFVNAIARFFKMPTVAQRSMLAEALMVSEDAMAATKAQRESGLPYKPVRDEVDNAPPSPYAVAGMFAKPRSFKDRIGGNLALAAEMHTVDMRAPVREALATGNKRLAEQAMYYIRKNDARMPQVYAVMQNGALGIKQDARGKYIVETGHSKSVQDVFKAIAALPGKDAAAKMEAAQAYLTAKRALANPKAAFALDLGKEGMTPEVLANDMRKLTADPKQKEALENVARVYADLNRGLIKFLQETGAISKDEAASYTADDSYVPYYRVRGDGVAELVFDETKTMRLGDIRTQPYLKALEGGDAKLLPLNEAITRNVMLLTDMGMRNLTTKNVAYALQDIGKAAKKMQIRTGDGEANVKALRFKQDGKPYHIIVDTEGTPAEGIPGDMVARSLEGTHVVIPSFLKAFGWAGDLLRAGVTRNPMYVARQLFRDPFAASFTGGLDRGPLTAVAKAMAAFVRQTAGRKDATADALVRKGVVQSGIFSGDPDDLSKMSMQLVGGDAGAFNKLFSAMDRAAMRADSVTRQQLYDDVLKRTGSEMEAEMAAMEMMNFHKRGLSPTVQYASRMIPFFNAQIQGLNVLHKALTGKATMQERLGVQQKFWDRAGMLMAGTLIYAMAMEDDDTYKNARASDKYGNWFVPLARDPENPKNDITLKLPIPFEVGLLFKALPEALLDYMRGTSTEQEWKAIRNLFLNQIPGGSSFLLPQLAKPLIEVGTNHSFFTSREIEGANMQGLAPQERYTARTTELAKRMSEMLQSDVTPDFLRLSPLQIEHLARGYLGSLPLMAAATMNDVFGTPNAAAPTRKLTETPLVGTSFQDRYGNGAADILYAKIKAADQVQTTYNKMLNEGRKQDAKMYLADVENLRELPMLRQAESKLQALAKQEKAIRSSDKLDADAKRDRLDAITARREAEARKYLDAVAAVAR